MSNHNQGGRKAVIILSGGLDSTTCMGIAQAKGYKLYPITFDYGQRHRIELDNARAVAEHYGAQGRHKVIQLGFLKEFGGSALTDDSIAVPDTTKAAEHTAQPESDIPVTYVPGRNLLFLSIATSYAEAIGAEAIFIGVNALDYSGYPDCRPEFIRKVEEVMAVATRVGVEGGPIRIETPLTEWTKAEIIRQGNMLQVPYHLTTSCYNGQAEACGVCDSCRLRLKGFAEAGSADPIAYRARH
ncbi:7-cyano-7-deazaguanine synthase QueC [Paenibacillus xerothermodurans]|uniref:7-cyano-7-deazaguanine synthase n=2 Tax=Paenibacillus xerothermodurans TaxID=1977292 RepID=A0A2W1P097_PAEXE|nr:7-cyano-7-deazaguanine synthase QueC [Paenibacillus xerothermodurans]PZE21162.1 7-cyano-7-deazaguanine synthase QueC [Paenibacillus xerothermodurans]